MIPELRDPRMRRTLDFFREFSDEATGFFCTFVLSFLKRTHFQNFSYMGGFFGTISKRPCATDLFYGIDYNSHLGTRRAGMVTFAPELGFSRAIHSLERSYFRTKF